MHSRKFNSYLATIFIFLGLFTISAYADRPPLKFSVYGGWEKTSIHQSHSFSLLGNQEEVLKPYHHRSDDFVSGIGVAYRFTPFCNRFFFYFTNDISVGIDFLHIRPMQHGDTLDYGIYNNFNYKLNIESTSFLLNGEWTFVPIAKCFSLFFVGGFGFAYNTVSYSDKPKSSFLSGIGMDIDKGSTLPFVYDVGAGVKFLFSKQLELSVRYLHSKLGSAKTSTTGTLPITSSIKLVPLTAEIWLAGLSFLM